MVNDPDASKNGNYQKINGQWQLSKYNPSLQIAQAIDELYQQFYNSFISKTYGSFVGVLVAFLDKNGNQTWLQANDTNGGLTDIAEFFIRDKLKLYNVANTDTVALTNEQGVTTWLQADKDGNLTDIAKDKITQALALNNLNQRLGISYNDTALLFAVLDKDNNQTWLQVASDGGLTDISEIAIREKLNLNQTTSTLGMFVLTDNDGNLTDIWLDNDGKISDRVLQDWHKRLKALNASDETKPVNEPILNLSHTLPTLTTQDLTINKHDTYFKDGELLPILPDNDKIILLGSSSLDNSQDEILPELQKLNPEITCYNPCFGGSVINQMSAMFGSIPLKLRFENNTINANGSSRATIQNNVYFVKTRMTMTGWVQGVHGMLTADNDGYSVVFNRTNSGQAVALTGEIDFIPERGNEYRNATQIIWIGKNNLYNANFEVHDVDKLLSQTDKLLSYNASFVKRNIVVTHFNNTNTSADSEARKRVNLVNHLYKLRYKNCVFDIEPIILGEQIFTDLGIPRTQADIEQQALGNLPPSLAHDAGHFNKQTNLYIASKLANFILAKKWF